MNYTGDWYGLYRERWGDDIVPDAYAHPAKYARGLIRRIYRHLLDEGYLRPGDTVLDPFGGVALGALDAMRQGLHWWGNELEEKFVKLGLQNLALWDRRYRPLWPDTWGSASLTMGDSRELGRVLARRRRELEVLGGVVSSPPYAESIAKDAGGRHDETYQNRWGGGDIPPRCYSDNPANLGNMGAVVSSPPFGEGETRDRSPVQGGEVADCITRAYTQDKQGTTPGNLAHMDAAISSPPYQTGGHHKHQMDAWNTNEGGHGWTQEKAGYGDSPGQVQGHGDDFWTAARAIVDQCYLLLKPGAVAVWVVKRFVRDKQIVDFPDQWRQMCEAAGFETVEWIRAWVVEEHGEQVDLWGNGHTQRKGRKSFFRRIYENKYPENRIDWEDVLIMRRL